jgi:hypothetical protein
MVSSTDRASSFSSWDPSNRLMSGSKFGRCSSRRGRRRRVEAEMKPDRADAAVSSGRCGNYILDSLACQNGDGLPPTIIVTRSCRSLAISKVMLARLNAAANSPAAGSSVNEIRRPVQTVPIGKVGSRTVHWASVNVLTISDANNPASDSCITSISNVLGCGDRAATILSCCSFDIRRPATLARIS